jgi:hypothetical protein
MSSLGAAFAVGFGVGAVVAVAVALIRLGSPPRALVRVNYAGREVPAVLGDSIIAGTLLAIGILAGAGATGWEAAEGTRIGAGAALLVGILGAAGRADDLRGDERERGFGGHLRAAAQGQVTGGAVKIIAGATAGLVAGALVESGLDVIVVGILIALAANTLNLFDRAPGRAGKLWILAVIPLFIWGPSAWSIAAAGMGGAVLVVMPIDFAARGMLGDAGVNPMGAVWGLGLAVTAGSTGRLAAIAVLVGLNIASERWSFSTIIDRTPPLRVLDRLGRK